jgi:acetylxylan esterase
MSRVSLSILATLPLSFVALTATSGAYASSFGQVDKAEWTNGVAVPGHIDMFMATPDVMPESPPIVVNLHACGIGNPAENQWNYQGFAPLRTALDSVGFIMILPQQTRNCFDSGSEGALTRGGNDDLSAIVQMVQYVLDTHNADPTRVYVMGGSGGGMATQALLGVYPDVFKAGHARAGAPAGCWGVSYDDGEQWSAPCGRGEVDKTPQEWGELVRSYYPDYTGPRPRVQINHGSADTTISFNNFQEGIDEWTNVLGLSAEPTSTREGVVGANTYYNMGANNDPAPYTYNIQTWNDECGYPVLDMWEAPGNGHSMAYEAQHILEFFGLEQTRVQDPWDEMCGDFVDPGTGGASGAGGSDPGAGGVGVGGGADPGAGGAIAAGGSDAGGSNFGTGATDAGVGGASAGGAPIGVGSGGTSSGGAGVAPSSGGNGVGAGDSGVAPAANSTSKGCSFVPGPSPGGVFAWALVLLGFGLRRRRTSRS